MMNHTRDEGIPAHEEVRYGSESERNEVRSDSGDDRDGSPQQSSPIQYGGYEEDHTGKYSIMNVDDRKRMPPQKAASPVVLQWLQDNYDSAEGASLPRSTLYAHYVSFCNSASIEPVNAASFGKLIRSIFPHLKTRRLGTRGHSKYHYYGIQIKSSSDLKLPAMQTSPDANTVARPKPPPRMKKEFEGEMKMQTPMYEAPTHTQIVCPQLPEFHLGDASSYTHESAEQIQTFLNLYRQHCQMLVDVVHRQSFAEVEKVLRTFWQGLPALYRSLVARPDVTDLIVHKDSITYKAMAHALLPNVLQALPVSVPQAIRNFAKQLEHWLMSALDSFPANLQIRKMNVTKRFCQSLHKQASLNHLTQAARNVLQNPNTLSQMIMDWNRLDFDFIRDQASWVCQCGDEIIQTAQEDFKNFLTQRATLEQWTQWLQDIVMKILGKCSDPKDLVYIAQQLLLKWSFYSTLIIRDLTIRNASSFSSYHLLRTLFDEYIFFLIDSKFATMSTGPSFNLNEETQVENSTPHGGYESMMKERSSYPNHIPNLASQHLSHSSQNLSHNSQGLSANFQHERAMSLLQDDEYGRYDMPTPTMPPMGTMSNLSHLSQHVTDPTPHTSHTSHIPQFPSSQTHRSSFNGVAAPPVLRQTMYSSAVPLQSQLSHLSQISQLSSQLHSQHNYQQYGMQQNPNLLSSHGNIGSHNSHSSHTTSPLAAYQSHSPHTSVPNTPSPNSSPSPSAAQQNSGQLSGQMPGQLSGQMSGQHIPRMDELRNHMNGSFDRLNSNLKRNSTDVMSQRSHGNMSSSQPMSYMTFANSELGTRYVHPNSETVHRMEAEIPKKPRVETSEVK